MSIYLPVSLRQRLLDADDHRCAYCLTTTANSGVRMTVDHIFPESKGGKTEFENLCSCCRACNEYKGDAAEAIDPLTGEITPLFNPRQQIWYDHFAWDAAGVHILGKSTIGRATIALLQMNNPTIIEARQRWVSVGWHPPQLAA